MFSQQLTWGDSSGRSEGGRRDGLQRGTGQACEQRSESAEKRESEQAKVDQHGSLSSSRNFLSRKGMFQLSKLLVLCASAWRSRRVGPSTAPLRWQVEKVESGGGTEIPAERRGKGGTHAGGSL